MRSGLGRVKNAWELLLEVRCLDEHEEAWGLKQEQPVLQNAGEERSTGLLLFRYLLP